MHYRATPPLCPPHLPARRRSIWFKNWLLRRPHHGNYVSLLHELHREDRKGYKKFMRVSAELFDEMVERLSHVLKKDETRLRKPLPVGLKLAVTLRFLATGNSYTDLQYSFHVSKSTISTFIQQVCRAITNVFKPEVLVCPRSPHEWKVVAEGFANKWNYLNCVGAIDGKHLPIKKPIGGGSKYFNYKGFNRIILMTVADAN